MAKANWKNRTLFHGDNLMFLRAMNSSSVDLMATDPPFNKGKDFHATPDSLASGARFQDRWSWKRDVHDEWCDTIQDDHFTLWAAIMSAKHGHSEGMGAFCCFMAVRLLAMHRILKPSGSIYVHCDQTANSYIRMMMDTIFGPKCFRNEIVWTYGLGGSSPRMYSKKHDTILFYTKSKDDKGYYFDKPEVPATSRLMKGQMKGQPDVFTDIPSLNNMSLERTGHPAQKPVELYARLIKASCPDGGIVLDPFAGCATTCVAAERLGMQWVGMDLWKDGGDVIAKRMKNECGDDAFFANPITLTTEPPIRTDDGLAASKHLKTPLTKFEAEGNRMSRDEMKRILLQEHGTGCQGCDREFHDHRYLELGHDTPRSDGGINHISNRVLLCGPCNKLKSNTYTLGGLRKMNKKHGYMCPGDDSWISKGRSKM